MIITETQRFVYSLLALTFVTIAVLVLLNLYALEIFLVLIIIEFLVLIELTKLCDQYGVEKVHRCICRYLRHCVCDHPLSKNGDYVNIKSTS